MTFEHVRNKVAIRGDIPQETLLSAGTTMELISLIQSNNNLSQQEAIDYLISCI